MEKEYLIRFYCFSLKDLEVMRCGIESDMLVVERSFSGMRGLLVMFDVYCSREGLMAMMACGVKYLPLNHYEDFEIRCPVCGEPIEDVMLLTVYDEHVLSGENILCGRRACGYQFADVSYIGE